MIQMVWSKLLRNLAYIKAQLKYQKKLLREWESTREWLFSSCFLTVGHNRSLLYVGERNLLFQFHFRLSNDHRILFQANNFYCGFLDFSVFWDKILYRAFESEISFEKKKLSWSHTRFSGIVAFKKKLLSRGKHFFV